jgi:hypothetical protein
MVCADAIPAEVTVIVPLRAPGARLAGFTDMLNDEGVIPDTVDTDNQAASTETVNGSAAPLLLPRFTVCGGGTVRPIWYANVSRAGLAVSDEGRGATCCWEISTSKEAPFNTALIANCLERP